MPHKGFKQSQGHIEKRVAATKLKGNRRSIRYADCHPDRKHKANGLCTKCFAKSGTRDKNCRKAECHPNLPHQAKGLCKPCYMKNYLGDYERSQESTNRRREDNWRRNGIKITVEEYNKMLNLQDGVCAICGLPPYGKRALAVDHDHGTGIVRGLLCDYCNRRLLIPRNSIEIFKRAIIYLSTSA